MASVNRTDPQGWAALMSVFVAGTCDLERSAATTGLMATLIDDTNSINGSGGTEFGTKAFIDGFTVLGELSSVTAKRQTVTGIVAVSGNEVRLDFADITFPTLAVGTNPVEHCQLFYKLQGAGAFPGSSEYVPLATIDAVKVPDGTDYIVQVPLNGLYFIDTT